MKEVEYCRCEEVPDIASSGIFFEIFTCFCFLICTVFSTIEKRNAECIPLPSLRRLNVNFPMLPLSTLRFAQFSEMALWSLSIFFADASTAIFPQEI